MRSDIYSLLVSGMRYFFVAAIVYILFRIVYHSVCEYNELRRVKSWLEKGYARHIEFLPPFDTNEEGFILAKSNIIGRGRKCDICIDDGSVRRKHAKIYEKGGFVYIRRYGRANILINGEPMEHKTEELAEGDLVQLEAVFLADLRVFFPVYPAKEHLQRADPQAAIPVQLAVDDTGHAAF